MTNQRQSTSDQAIFGGNIRALRLTAGLSQVDLAKAMAQRGFTAWRQTTVSRTEQGERQARLDELAVLEEILGGDLWNGTELARTFPTNVARAVTRRRIEAKIAKLEKEIDELRDLWDAYTKEGTR